MQARLGSPGKQELPLERFKPAVDSDVHPPTASPLPPRLERHWLRQAVDVAGEAVSSIATMATTTGTADAGTQTIILALDASEMAEFAVNWYVNRVHRPGNRLVFVHCIELPELKLNQARSMHMSPGVLAGMWKEEEVKTKNLEEKIKSLLKEKGMSGILRTATGKPGEVICRIAEEEGAVMIVTGTRGMGKVRRTILGSVSDYLVHHAHCPVIVCRHPDTIKKRRPSGEGKRSRNTSGDSSKSSGSRPPSRGTSLSSDNEV